MPKSVLIIEKDVALMRTVAQSLTGRGVTVEESTDGKGAPEAIRKQRPDCVVLAVDLDSGQNGYILCKKIKSDDDLKSVPVIIIGDPKGFAQHQKLKTRAEDYVGKPLAVDQLVDAVGKIIGFDEITGEEPVEEFDPASLLEDSAAFPVEEVSLDSTGETAVPPTEAADFEMVDAMFDDAKPAAPTEVEPPAADMGLGASDFEGEERTVVGFLPVPTTTVPAATAPPARASAAEKKAPAAAAATKVHAFTASSPSSSPSGLTSGDAAESRELRAKVTELTGSIDDANKRASELETKLSELQSELEAKQTELETARSASASGSKSDKDVFALRDSVNKKDKEILRLKSELNDKEKEIVELREKENTFDQQVSESSGELAKRDAQIKTLTTKTDQLTIERKRIDTQLAAAKEEARGTAAKLTTLQADFDALQARNAELEGELEPMRAARAELETARNELDTQLADARGEIESMRSQVDERTREAEEARGQVDGLNAELESTRAQVTSQAQAFADEISGLRQRVSELETETQKQEERATRSVERVKAHQEQAERVRQALQMAMGHLEQPADVEELDIDEIAEA